MRIEDLKANQEAYFVWKSIARTRGYGLSLISDFSVVLHRMKQFMGFPPAGITGERGEEKKFLSFD